jgi:hypothetical protein
MPEDLAIERLQAPPVAIAQQSADRGCEQLELIRRGPSLRHVAVATRSEPLRDAA